MGEMIRLKAEDGFEIGGYQAMPAGPPKGGIVVVQEIFGVNHHIRSVADGYAAEGYAVIAPAYFDRVERDVELGYDDEGRTKGIALMQGLGGFDNALKDTAAAVKALAGFGKVGIVGYCWGGTVAYLAAAKLPGLAAAVGYYGGGIAKNAGQMVRCPTILHFGEEDHGIPMSDVETVQKAHPDMAIFTYKAGHGFNCSERGSYDAASAKLAFERTLEFFKDKISQ